MGNIKINKQTIAGEIKKKRIFRMNKKKPIKISSRKGKGRNLQKWVCKIISDIVGIPWGKDEDIEPRPMGQSGVDVILRGKAKEIFPFSIECKNQESWSVHSWIDQAKQNEKEGTDWLLVCKRNKNKPVIILDAETFFKMLFAINPN